MRRFIATLCLTALCGTCHAQPALPGTDIKSYLTADISAKLSLAGTWTPIDAAGDQAGTLVGPYWGVIKLGASQREGIALGGWVSGALANMLPDVTPVGAALLEQKDDGTLLDATVPMLGNAVTNGAGSVIVADFNGDGLDDLVFPAFNETPHIWKRSTAFISRPDGGFDKLMLDDNVMAHDARLVTLDGRKKILARSFGNSGNPPTGAYSNVIYTWTGNTLTADKSLGDLGGMSVLAGAFAGNADTWLIVGDSAGGGPGGVYSATNPMLNYAYKYSGGAVVLPRVLLPKPYFNDKPAYAGFQSLWDPYSKTHTSRLWTSDLNQDGLPDILAGQEIWTAGPAGLQKAVFQLLINRGNMVFTDDTDDLAPEFNQDSFIDYSVRLADVDGSGIETMFHSPPGSNYASEDPTKQGQYILVNDGTGRLYAAMHDEFRAMRAQIESFLGTATGITPQFVAYRTASGTLNFVAIVKHWNSIAPNHRASFVNVPLGINLTTDFRRDLTIATRNGSKRIRTFAGNDTIHRALADPDCNIDGGLGTNTVVYPGKRADWTLIGVGGVIMVKPASGPGGTDSLTRIQIGRFDDQDVDLTALPPSTAVSVIEYRHSAFNHYFITPVAAEIALLDAHAPPFQDWSRTGFSFNAYVNAGAPGGSVAICRFFNDHFAPKSSHFYAAHGLGCEATIAQFPDWKLEDDKLFNTMLPDSTTGACPAGTISVYRMYNQGMGAAPNHRFVTSLAERQKMIDQGFVAEGAGVGVGMCVPP